MSTQFYANEVTGAGTGMFGSWGFIIFFLFILWFLFDKNKEGYCNQDARADRIRDTAEIEYRNLEEQRSAKEQIMAQASAIRNEQQAETMFDLKIENTTLKQNNVMLEKFAELKAEMAACCCNFNRRLDQVPMAPPVWAQSYAPAGQPIPDHGGFRYNRDRGYDY